MQGMVTCRGCCACVPCGVWQVWISYATFEATDAQEPDNARAIFKRAYEHMKQAHRHCEHCVGMWESRVCALG